MLYIILDPGCSYPAQMVEFLGSHERQGIAIFTNEGQYHAFHNDYHNLKELIADEYLATEFEDVSSLAQRILNDHGAEIEGIIPWDEFGIEFGAELAEELQLDWNPLEVIQRFRNKYSLKEHLRNNCDLRINASQVVTSEEEALDFQKSLNRWPIVIKPSKGAGSSNVFFANSEEELSNRCIEVFHSGLGEVLLEEYIGGNEFVVNGITDSENNILVTDVWYYDKRDSHGMKNLYYQTIKVNSYDPVFAPLVMYAGDIITTLGLRKCPFHMEIKLDQYGPCLIEVGARFAGGNQPLLASELHHHSLFELAACHYLANFPVDISDVDYEYYDSFQARIVNGIQSFEIPQITNVYGVEEVQSLDSFFMFGFIKPRGSYLPITKDLFGKSYEVYLVNKDQQQIEVDSQKVREWLQYE